MKKTKLLLLASFMTAASATATMAQTQVSVNLDVRHKMGDVDSFDRQKFVNFHSTTTDPEWDKNNTMEDLRKELLIDLDVYLGRDTGGVKSTLMAASEDPERPGFVDPEYIAKAGAAQRANYARNTTVHPYEDRSNWIICNQFHPFYPDGTPTNTGWALSQADTDDEPYGTASGEYYGRYIKESFGKGGATGQPAPSFCEVINEPMWDIYDKPNAPKSSITQLFKFHSTVARQVRKYNPKMQVGGFCTAFPDFDVDNFERWNTRWKHFIDIAGEDMDFWTIHLYDFPCKVFSEDDVRQMYRKGSNVEATMDMLEQYSMIKFGKTKPLMISEYAAQTHLYNDQPWSPYRDWLRNKSTISLMMQFMERADKINIAIPFTMLKCEWQYHPGHLIPHLARMMRRENEPESYTGDYVFSDLVLVNRLWKDVKGTRIDTKTSNLDIMCDAYVDGNKAYIAINNLDFDPIDLDLDILGTDQKPEAIEVRYIHLVGGLGTGGSSFEQTTATHLDRLTIDGEATYMLVYTFADDIKIDKLNEERKYYATEYLKPIAANETITFEINDVKLKRYGEATLRIGVGRDHGKALNPKVTINGHELAEVENCRGDWQEGRSNYFGVLELPVRYDQLLRDNTIEVTLPDNGGYVSTMTMQLFNFSEEIR